MQKRLILISLLVVVICFVGIFAIIGIYKGNSDFFNQCKRFSVTIDNQSDFDLLTIEAGVIESDSQGNAIEGNSKVILEDKLESGSKFSIKPDLHLIGEGGVYLKFTDSRGETTKKTVCSYTESLSGYSEVIVKNDTVDVIENCS